MKLAFVCNQNQARSQVLSSIFTSMLPTWEVTSFGLIAREGTPLPVVIESVFHDWGLESKNRFAKNLSVHWDEVVEMDLVVAVTSFIAEEVKSLGFRGAILNLEQEASRLSIAIMDPQLMPRRQCAFELAKYLKVAVSAFQRIGLIRRGSQILALLPESERAVDKAIEIALDNGGIQSSVLMGDLVAPRGAQRFATDLSISHFKINETTTSIVTVHESSKDKSIYLPRSASIRPSQVYLTKTWHDLILQLSTHSLTIITPPEQNARGMIAESYLAALYADKVQTVQI